MERLCEPTTAEAKVKGRMLQPEPEVWPWVQVLERARSPRVRVTRVRDSFPSRARVAVAPGGDGYATGYCCYSVQQLRDQASRTWTVCAGQAAMAT